MPWRDTPRRDMSPARTCMAAARMGIPSSAVDTHRERRHPESRSRERRGHPEPRGGDRNERTPHRLHDRHNARPRPGGSRSCGVRRHGPDPADGGTAGGSAPVELVHDRVDSQPRQRGIHGSGVLPAAWHRQPVPALGRRPDRPGRHADARERRRDVTSTSKRSAPCASPATPNGSSSPRACSHKPSARAPATRSARTSPACRRRSPSASARSPGCSACTRPCPRPTPSSASTSVSSRPLATPPPSACAPSTRTAATRGSATSRCASTRSARWPSRTTFPTSPPRTPASSSR